MQLVVMIMLDDEDCPCEFKSVMSVAIIFVGKFFTLFFAVCTGSCVAVAIQCLYFRHCNRR